MKIVKVIDMKHHCEHHTNTCIHHEIDQEVYVYANTSMGNCSNVEVVDLF